MLRSRSKGSHHQIREKITNIAKMAGGKKSSKSFSSKIRHEWQNFKDNATYLANTIIGESDSNSKRVLERRALRDSKIKVERKVMYNSKGKDDHNGNDNSNGKERTIINGKDNSKGEDFIHICKTEYICVLLVVFTFGFVIGKLS